MRTMNRDLKNSLVLVLFFILTGSTQLLHPVIEHSEHMGQLLLKNFPPAESRSDIYQARLTFPKPELSLYESHSSILTLLSEHESAQYKYTGTHELARSCMEDLQLFHYDSSRPDKNILAHIDRSKTKLGRVALGNLLAHPTTNVSLLRKRQALIAHLVHNHELRTSLQEGFTEFANHEDDLLSLWNDNDLLYGKNVKESFYEGDWDRWLTPGSARSLEIKRLRADFLMIFLPALLYGFSRAFSVLPLGVGNFLMSMTDKHTRTALEQKKLNRERAAENKKYEKYTSMLITAMLSFVSYRRLWTKFKNRSDIVAHIRERFASLVNFQEKLESVRALLEAHQELGDLFEEQEKIKAFFSESDQIAREFIQNLKTDTFESNTYFSFVGPVFQALPQFLSLRDKFAPALHALGKLDAYCGLAQLYHEHQDENLSGTYSFPHYVTSSDRPVLITTSCWHPLLNPESVVTNSARFDAENSQNMVLTGPNAAGKSTVLKSILLTVLLGQTVGIVPAERARFTPFSILNSYLHITDDIALGKSLFKAEVGRAYELIQAIESLGEREFALTIMDEIFSGTNPLQGQAAAYAVMHALAHQKNSCVLLATHFPVLTHLEKETNGLSKNYHVLAHKQEDNSFYYPYTLRPGPSKQAIALALLENEGFDETILSYAYEHLAEHPARTHLRSQLDYIFKTLL